MLTNVTHITVLANITTKSQQPSQLGKCHNQIPTTVTARSDGTIQFDNLIASEDNAIKSRRQVSYHR